MADNSLALRKKTEKDIVQVDEMGYVTLNITPELREKYNVLAPTAVIVQQDPAFKPSFTIVQLDPNDDDHFYPLQGQLAPCKNGIIQITEGGGMIWDTDESGGTEGDVHEIELDVRGHKRTLLVREYEYEAVGYVRKSDGHKAPTSSPNKWDPRRQLIELETSKTKKSSAQITKEFMAAWKVAPQMCKTKARLACLREAFGLKQKYTRAEAEKPFLIVGYNLDMEHDSDLRRAFLAEASGMSLEALYGPEATPKALEAPTEEEDDFGDEPGAEKVVDGEVVEEEETPESDPWDEVPRSLMEWEIPAPSTHAGRTLSAVLLGNDGKDAFPGWFIHVLENMVDAKTEAGQDTYTHVIDFMEEIRRAGIEVSYE